jgi:glycosyltransferase involved in cell wall biosynthesis
MKLLISISYYYPNISGLTIYAKRVAEEMVKKGLEVNILTSHYKKDLPLQEKINGVLIKRVWTPLVFGRGPIMPTFLYDSYKAVKNSDVINCHLPQFESLFLAVWAKIFKKRIIVTYHCDLASWPGLINKIQISIVYLSHLFTCFLADRVVSSSKDYADNSKFLSLFKNKLVFVFPPIILERSSGEFKNRWSDIQYKIGFVGRIAKEKGIDNLLKSIPEIKKRIGNNFRIFIVGPEEVVGGGAKNELYSLIEEYKKHLVILGVLKEGELEDFYKMIDVLVLPSTQSLEAFGMVQVEAMLSGCPVIASDLPGVRIPIKLTGMGKIFETNDSNLLGQIIAKILKNKKKYIKPKSEIEKFFSYQKTISSYINLFKN